MCAKSIEGILATKTYCASAVKNPGAEFRGALLDERGWRLPRAALRSKTLLPEFVVEKSDCRSKTSIAAAFIGYAIHQEVSAVRANNFAIVLY